MTPSPETAQFANATAGGLVSSSDRTEGTVAYQIPSRNEPANLGLSGSGSVDLGEDQRHQVARYLRRVSELLARSKSNAEDMSNCFQDLDGARNVLIRIMTYDKILGADLIQTLGMMVDCVDNLLDFPKEGLKNRMLALADVTSEMSNRVYAVSAKDTERWETTLIQAGFDPF